MPIYEFHCPDNRRIYSFFARSLSYSSKTPRCPDNPKFRMEKMVSNFAVTGRAKEKPDLPPGGGEEDSQMMAAMAQMEREFSSIDAENPDPRQLAQMMRRMSSLTGEKITGEMDEMMRRMEAGEDPEKIEEDYAGVADEMEGMGGPGAGEGEESAAQMKSRLRALRQRTTRDPMLYEMSEYVD